jgi:arylformamidase
MDGIDWDDAFANAPYIEGAEGYPAAWAEAAAQFRAQARARLDLPYQHHARARFDLFLPDTPSPRGLVVFVHGGYWLRFGKSDWSHLAAGPVAQGWAVALPGYTLAPEAQISEITAQIASAITAASAEVAGPIHLAGHSAGGHLVTRMLCTPSPLPPHVLSRLGHVLSISGLHDLRPLRATQLGATLRLTPDEAARESAALHAPVQGSAVTAWVGGHERPEFLRQSAVLREAWARKGADARLVVEPGLHHFNVIAGLAQGDSAITRALLLPGG